MGLIEMSGDDVGMDKNLTSGPAASGSDQAPAVRACLRSKDWILLGTYLPGHGGLGSSGPS
jgi:hypothetical protein